MWLVTSRTPLTATQVYCLCSRGRLYGTLRTEARIRVNRLPGFAAEQKMRMKSWWVGLSSGAGLLCLKCRGN